MLVGANKIETLALRFGLTVDQVTREFESWGMCARTPIPSASVCPPLPPHAGGCPRAHSLLSCTERAVGGRGRSFIHGGIMRWLGKNISALTNRAEACGAFCTRHDKRAEATAAWQPMTFGNLGMALNWYLTQQLLVLCPDYGTLQQTDPRAAAAVKEKAGQMLLVDAVPDQRFIDQVVQWGSTTST